MTRDKPAKKIATCDMVFSETRHMTFFFLFFFIEYAILLFKKFDKRHETPYPYPL